MNTREYVLTFARTHDAMRAEQVLLAAGIAPGVMPLPSTIRAGCGLCLRIPPAFRAAAQHALSSEDCEYQELYLRTVQNGKSTYAQYTEGEKDEST